MTLMRSNAMALAIAASTVAAAAGARGRRRGGRSSSAPRSPPSAPRRPATRTARFPSTAGGVTTPPPGYVKASGLLADPFANDKPLFTITAKNVDQLRRQAVRGDPGAVREVPRLPHGRVPHAAQRGLPEDRARQHVKNATRCKTIENGLALMPECRGGIPFPIPKNGDEAMWDHLLRFQGYYYDFRAKTYVVDSSGRATMTDDFTAQQEWPYYLDNPPRPRSSTACARTS
jgi:hypothetical protein